MKDRKSKKLSDRFKTTSLNKLNLPHYKTVQKIVIPIPPITKKNSNEIVRTKAKHDEKGNVIKPSQVRIVASAAFRKYEKAAKPFLPLNMNIAAPVNIKAVYYLDTAKYSDLNNYHNALHDVLVDYDVIYDDNHYIVTSTDGSCIRIDKERPRTEIYIQVRTNDKEKETNIGRT